MTLSTRVISLSGIVPKVANVLGALLCIVEGLADVPKVITFDGSEYHLEGVNKNGGGDFFNLPYYPEGKRSSTAAKRVEFFRQQISVERIDQLIDIHVKTVQAWDPQGSVTVLEKSEDRLVLKMDRRDPIKPRRDFYHLHIYELEERTLLTTQFLFYPRAPFESEKEYSAEQEKKEKTWLKELDALGKSIHKALRKVALKGK